MIVDFTPRLYQQTILATTAKSNSLVVLPTGLGKTAIAFMLTAQRLRLYPNSKILILAPTKPLCEQHQTSFQKHLDIDNDKVVLFTGTIKPEIRGQLFKEAQIIISTPQGLENDLINRRVLFEDVSLLVVDECVTEGTKITLANGQKISIEKLEERVKLENIFVESVDQRTGNLEPAKVTKFHKIKSQKAILQIGLGKDKIKTTKDHRFLTKIKEKVEWTEARNIKKGDLVATIENTHLNKKNSILVSKEDIIKQFSERQQELLENYLKAIKIRKATGLGAREISKRLNFNEGTIRNWVNSPFRQPVIFHVTKKLESLELLPLYSNNFFLPIIARLFGHLFGDGWANYDKKGNMILGFSGKINDLENIQSDLDLFSFSYSSIYSRNTTSIINHLNRGEKIVQGVSNSFTVSDRNLTKLFVALGLPVGDKTKNMFFVPEWIMNGSKRVKKEFISSLMGSDGYTCTIKKNLKTCNPVRLTFNVINQLEKEGQKYAQQLVDLFLYFNIKLSISKRVGNIRKDGDVTLKFVLTLSNSNESMEIFLKQINYTYALEKRLQANLLLVYIKKKKENLNERISLFEKACKLHKEGLGSHKIARRLDQKIGLIENWIYFNMKPSMITTKMEMMDLNQKDISNFTVTWEKVKTITERQDEEYVYDLTVAKNHNYVANNFVVHNCHHATGEYSYVWLTKQYIEKAYNPRILALTASPGSDIDKIHEVCANLNIESVEVRTVKDPDVKPYIQETDIEWVGVEFPEHYKVVHTALSRMVKSKVAQLQQFDVQTKGTVTKTQLLKLQGILRARISKGVADYDAMKALSLLAQCVKIEHALELLECQGVKPLYEYLHRLELEAPKTKVKAVKNIVADPNFRAALVLTKSTIERNIEYPKKTLLLERVTHTVSKDKNSKIIVFSNLRDTAQDISHSLNDIGITNRLFVGQTKKNGIGLSQKEQKAILEEFRGGEFNVLIATSVGEEGLDIPSVNQVIFYEPTPSAVRTIQRRGRTGRSEKGEVTILFTKGTRDEAYRWAAHHKEKKMHDNLEKIKLSFKQKKAVPTAATFSTAALSGNKTLDSFDNNNESETNNTVLVLADHREKNNKITKELMNLDVSVRLAQLTSADYVLSGVVGVELKKVGDFVDSLLDGRLLTQIKELRSNFAKAVLIIEGEQDIYAARNVHANAIRGALASIILGYGVPILHTKDEIDTAALLAVMAKREQQKESSSFSLHHAKPLTLKDQQEFIVSAFPSVGNNTAKILLEHFKSVKNLVNATQEDLMNVKGIGKNIAKSLVDVFNEKY
jgi:ERCC4-related helicase/intein/homing endonuclease